MGQTEGGAQVVASHVIKKIATEVKPSRETQKRKARDKMAPHAPPNHDVNGPQKADEPYRAKSEGGIYGKRHGSAGLGAVPNSVLRWRIGFMATAKAWPPRWRVPPIFVVGVGVVTGGWRCACATMSVVV